MDLLSVENMSVQYQSRQGCIVAMDNVSFALSRGRCIGLVGESGSGKSTIGHAIMRLLPGNATILSGRIMLDGTDVLMLSDDRMRQIRWRKVSMIFQAAMNALNPIMRIDDQILEAMRIHLPALKRQEALARVSELFAQVGIPDDRRGDYPHQYSGGMRQRAVIAMALACRPELVIADEPTTALDVIVQDQILTVLRHLRQTYCMSILLISHDISVVAELSDSIAVLYAGQVVETGLRHEVFETPGHPYTRALLDAYITLAVKKHRAEPLKEAGAALSIPTTGCCFVRRCPIGDQACKKTTPLLRRLSDTHHVRCHKE